MNRLIVAAIRCSLTFILPTVAYAISSQWDLDPILGDWNTAASWTPTGAPNGPADIATFGLSNTTDVSISADTEVNGITFTAAATARVQGTRTFLAKAAPCNSRTDRPPAARPSPTKITAQQTFSIDPRPAAVYPAKTTTNFSSPNAVRNSAYGPQV